MHGRPPRPGAGTPKAPFPEFPRSWAPLFPYRFGGCPVTEGDGEKKPVETIKDERDLLIEQLTARLDKIETEYGKKIGDYQKANSELWARLHPAAKETEIPVPDPAPDNGWNIDKAVEAYHAALGIENKKE